MAIVSGGRAGGTPGLPWTALGAKATAADGGRTIGVAPTEDGAWLHTGFQKLAGSVTGRGLVLVSTEPGGEGQLRLGATAVERIEPAFWLPGDPGFAYSSRLDFPATGTVAVGEKTASFFRRGITEEYSVSADGVRQDFILTERPCGQGPLLVTLDLEGATGQASPDGVRLTLGSGRVLAYTRLHVTDGAGRELAAEMEVPSPGQLAIRVDDANAVYPVRIDPTFSDADWVSMNPGAPDSGVLDRPSALAVRGSELFAGGSFLTVPGVGGVNHIARWNGSTWSALGTGTNDTVNALAVSGNDLYVGGYFTLAGGVPGTNRIAKWNGTTWSALGTGVAGADAAVHALAVSGSTVYAGGFFSSAGGVPAANIAKWDGSAWSALGAGVTDTVWALAASGSTVYAGGDFLFATGVSGTAYIAKWNGTAWSGLGNGVNDEVNALALNGSDLYVGGDFSAALGVGGTAYIAKWNGSAWSSLGTGMNDIVEAIAVNGTDVYAGGDFTQAGGVPANNIAVWNGSAWSAIGSGVNDSVWALAAGGGNVFAGGIFTTAGGKSSPYLARLNTGGSAAADQDGDGLPDFAETYFGTSASVPNGWPVTVTRTGSQIVLRWPEANPAGVTVTPQWSPDLVTWLASGQTANGIAARTLAVSSPAAGQKQAALDPTGLPWAFLRLSLAKP